LVPFPLLQGCVGFAVLHARTDTINKPAIREYPSIPWSVYHDETGKKDPVTAAWLEEHWGKPASIRPLPEGAGELWAYEFRHIWYGLRLALIVTLPLDLPLRKEEIAFRVKDGLIVSATITRSSLTGGGLILLTPEGPREWKASYP